MQLGKWSFDETDRIVITPQEAKVRLTETEWQFLWYLLRRDVMRSTLVGEATAAFEAVQRKDAIVYKIRSKLGEDFPLERERSGGYSVRSEAL